MKSRFTYRFIVLLGIVILQFLFSGRLFAQKQIVTGKVTGAEGQPIGRVEVRCNEQVVFTSPNGTFLLEVIAFPATVQFFEDDYYERTAIAANPVNDTVWLEIQLKPLETDLEEVVISAERVQWVYPKKNVHIIDFEVQPDGGLLLLCKDQKTYFLRLTDADDETVNELEIREHPVRFFKDCLGEVHIVYRDSCYQIVRENDRLSLMNGLLWQKVREALSSCVLAWGDKMYFREYGRHGQTAWIFQYNRFLDKRKLLYVAENRKAARELDEYYNQALAEKGGGELINASDIDALKRARHAYQQLLFYDEVLAKPIYIPMFSLSDSLLLFDHVNDSICVFSPAGTVLSRIPITHHLHRKWAGEVLTDAEKRRFFAVLDYGGMIRLLEINPQTGETGREIELEKHIYPTKIQIQGNYVYYLFHHFVDNSINYIYRQRID